MRWLDGITDSMEMNLSKFQDMVKDREACCAAAPGVTEFDMTEWLNNNATYILLATSFEKFYLFSWKAETNQPVFPPQKIKDSEAIK